MAEDRRQQQLARQYLLILAGGALAGRVVGGLFGDTVGTVGMIAVPLWMHGMMCSLGSWGTAVDWSECYDPQGFGRLLGNAF